MSYKQMARRLEELEGKRAQQDRAERRAWVEALSFEELEVLAADYADRDPVGNAAVEAMSEADLERLCDGKMPDAEWQQHLQRAQERINAAP